MATLETLIDKRLDDDCEDTGEVRQAARQYYLSLVQEDIGSGDGMALSESLDGNELAAMGFVAGYQACRSAHGIS